MKRYFYLIAAIAGLLMAASCQKEDFAVADGDYAEVSFTADLPGVATKAIADGQTVNKLYYEVYPAEDADGTVAAEAQAVVDGTAEISAGNATVNVRLVKNKKYTVFFWAQFEETGYTSPYTCTDLRNITVSYDGAVANDENRDAFYAVEKAVSFSSAATEKVTLTRPFAQVNVATSDLTTLTAQGITLGNTSISVSDVATSFAPFTGVASGSADAEFAAAAMADEDLTTNGKTYDYLAMAYVLVPGSADDTSVSNISSTVSFTGLDPITVSYEGATLKQNHRTNIVGNLLTSSVDFEVTVDSDFDGADSNLPMGPDDLAAKLNAYTSTEAVVYNIVSPSTVAGIDIEIPSTFAAETVTFNFIEVKTGATLTIKDATGGAFNKNVVINLPENVNTSNLTINLPNAHVTLEQGNVTTVISSTSSTTFVVADGVKVENITVNAGNVTIEEGGEVKVIEVGENNSDEETTVTVNEGANVPVVRGKEGSSIVVQNVSDNGDVVESAPINIGKFTYNKNGEWNASETLKDAIDNADVNTTVTMGADVTSSDIIIIGKSLTLNGNGYSLTSTAGRAINVSGAADVTIKNLTISASGERAINVIQNATNVTIDNVTATSANYTVNVAGSAPDAVVSIMNSTLTGLCTVNVAAEGAKVTVDKSTINCVDNNTTEGESYAALCLNKDAIGGSIVATNSTINVTEDSDSYKGRNGADNGLVTIDGSSDEVIVMLAVITYPESDYYYSFHTLAKAVEFATDGDKISLIRNVEQSQTINITKNITIDLNGYKLTNNVKGGRVFDITADDVIFTLDATDSEVEFGNGTYGMIQLVAGTDNAKITITGGTFTGTTDAGALIRYRSGNNNAVTLTNVNYTDNCEVKGANVSNAYVISSNGASGTGNSITVTGGNFKACGIIADAILNAKFTGVNVYATGAGFELSNGTISNSTITLDPGSYVYSADGGAVSVSHSGTINISDSKVVSQSYGYVVYPTGGTINITDCTIEGKEENQDKWYYIYDQYSGKTGTIIIDGVTKETKSNP